jgi:hypothetical protein
MTRPSPLAIQSHLLWSCLLHLKKQTSSYRETVQLSIASLKSLRKALQLSQELCHARGFWSADLNLTFLSTDPPAAGVQEAMVMRHDQYPPLLHSLTPIYSNSPDLLNFSKHFPAPHRTPKPESFEQSLEGILRINKSLRAGPVDATEVHPSSNFYTNLYLSEVRLLAICYSALCEVTEEVRMAHIPWRLLKELNRDDAEDLSSGDEVKEEISYEESNLSEKSLLKEQLCCGEEGLKVAPSSSSSSSMA